MVRKGSYWGSPAHLKNGLTEPIVPLDARLAGYTFSRAVPRNARSASFRSFLREISCNADLVNFCGGFKTRPFQWE